MDVKQKAKPNNKSRFDVVQEMAAHKGTVRNLGTGHRVEVFWGLNESMNRDGVIKLKIGENEAYVQVEELLRYTRWATT